jgi:hypothetical protein
VISLATVVALSGYAQTAVAVGICFLAIAGLAAAGGYRRFAVGTLIALALVAMTICGLIGIAVSGFCDTSCPSSTLVAISWALVVVGLAGLLECCSWRV